MKKQPKHQYIHSTQSGRETHKIRERREVHPLPGRGGGSGMLAGEEELFLRKNKKKDK